MVSLKKLKEGLSETSCISISVNDPKHHTSSSDADIKTALTNNKENSSNFGSNKENEVPNTSKVVYNSNVLCTRKALKPNSLETCMRMGEEEKACKQKTWDGVDEESGSCLNIWDYSSDLEAAPASSWASLPNRALLCRALPVDVGRCSCVIVKEESIKGLEGGTLYSLYTNEGKGRQDRKLAVAHHRRYNGKTEFRIAQNLKGILCGSDDSFLGNVTANFFGSKYYILSQSGRLNMSAKQNNLLIAVVEFMPTIATWTGRYRSIKAYIPKHQSMQLKNTTQVQHVNCLPKDWQGKLDKLYKLSSKVPHYNHNSKQYELDFRDRGRAGPKILSSVKNFQMTLEENEKQTILQLGRMSKSKFVMDFRYPLTGFQAFCMSLASIDSKVCCAI